MTRPFDRFKTETLLRAMLAEEGIDQPQTWALETILEFEELDGEIPEEHFNYQLQKKMFLFMYNVLIERAC